MGGKVVMSNRSIALLTAAVSMMLVINGRVLALEDENEKTGFTPNHVFSSSAEDTIDVLNGNLTFSIPIYTVPVARDLSLNVGLTYNSKVWDLTDHSDPPQTNFKVKLLSKGEVGLGF